MRKQWGLFHVAVGKLEQLALLGVLAGGTVGCLNSVVVVVVWY